MDDLWVWGVNDTNADATFYNAIANDGVMVRPNS